MYEHESMDDGSDGKRDGPLRQREKPRGWTCKDPERSIRANRSGCYNSPTTYYVV